MSGAGFPLNAPIWVIIALSGILLILSMNPFRSYGTIFTFAGPVVVPLIYFADPVLAGLLVSVSSFSLDELKVKSARFSKFLFNRTDTFLAGLSASYCFHSLHRVATGPWDLLWLLFAATAYYLVNHLLYYLALFFLGGPPQRFYSALLPTLIKSTPMSTILGVLFIQSYQTFHFAGLLIFLLLLIMLNREASASLMNAKSFLQIIDAFVETIEAKDHYTRGHSERVAELVRKIATEMGLPKKLVKTFYEVAKLHDVGKIGVMEGILKKEKHLTQDEYEAVKQHPVIGARIVSRVDALSEFAPLIRSHHERWDGHGYPEGLIGASIPLGARIIAVADTFDAITSDRPYRQALTFDSAVSELLACAGTQFDRDVVLAAVQVLRRDAPAPVLSGAEAAAAGQPETAE